MVCFRRYNKNGMAAKKKKQKVQPVAAEPPTIHEAEPGSGPSGIIIRGNEIDLATAIARRQSGQDVVVCGNDLRANRTLARLIEQGVGPPTRPQEPHKKAGPFALPHFHQESRDPAGHTFYETDNLQKKARKKT